MVIELSSAFKTEPELIAWIERSSYPQKGNEETARFFDHPGEFLPGAVEIKYFRKMDGEINCPYYAGLDQALAYLKFGFHRIYLWHFFDHEIPKKKARRYINHVVDLLEHLSLPVPLMYDYYLVEQGDEKTEFDIHKLEQGYGSFNVNWVNPYYNEERAATIRQFILDEMGTSFLQL